LSDEVPRFLHAAYIGIDANFKMKRKNVSNNTNDPSFLDGKAYIVKQGPFEEYLLSHEQVRQEVGGGLALYQELISH
jgi:hypothetical protein